MSLVELSSFVRTAAPWQVAANVAKGVVASPGAALKPLMDGTTPEQFIKTPGMVGFASGAYPRSDTTSAATLISPLVHRRVCGVRIHGMEHPKKVVPLEKIWEKASLTALLRFLRTGELHEKVVMKSEQC